MTGSDFGRELARRVRAIKKRLGTRSVRDQLEWERRLTWFSFAERIGLSDEALRVRLGVTTSFQAQELATICAKFRVRADYLLLGRGPMLDADLTDAETRPHESFAAALHRRLAQVLETRTEQEAEWVASHLPNADELLRAIEHGVADALAANVQAYVDDRLLANQSVRLAVAERVQAASTITTSPDAFFGEATAGRIEGTLIDLGQNRADRPR